MTQSEQVIVKKAIIDALRKTGASNLTEAAQKIGVNKLMIYEWKRKDSEFAEALEEILHDHRVSFVDTAEKTLKEAVERGDMTATIFALKTLGRNRGYEQSAKLTVDHSHVVEMDITEAARRIAFAMNTAGIRTIDGNFTEVLESPALLEAGIITPPADVAPELTAVDVMQKVEQSKARKLKRKAEHQKIVSD